MYIHAWWYAPSILAFYTALSLIVAFVLWKFLPGSNAATFEGKKWKLGGSFAGFIFTMYVMNSTYTSIEERIIQTQNNISDVKLELIGSPGKSDEYSQLFYDLQPGSNFLAFNPPFEVEKNVGMEKSVAAHAKRYMIDKVNSRYIFLNQTSYQNALNFFALLKKKIGEETFSRHIKYVLWEDAPISSCNTYFISEKGDKKVFIFYPNPHGKSEQGIPDYVVAIKGDSSVWEKYEIKFNRLWSRANEIMNIKENRKELSAL